MHRASYGAPAQNQKHSYLVFCYGQLCDEKSSILFSILRYSSTWYRVLEEQLLVMYLYSKVLLRLKNISRSDHPHTALVGYHLLLATDTEIMYYLVCSSNSLLPTVYGTFIPYVLR